MAGAAKRTSVKKSAFPERAESPAACKLGVKKNKIKVGEQGKRGSVDRGEGSR